MKRLQQVVREALGAFITGGSTQGGGANIFGVPASQISAAARGGPAAVSTLPVTDFVPSRVPTFPTGLVYNRQIRCARKTDDSTVGYTMCNYSTYPQADSCCQKTFNRSDIQACRKSTFA